MWRTLVHQTYTRSVAVDSSGNSNNGVPVLVTPASPGFAYNQPGGRINTRPSLTLENLENARAVVRFTLDPTGTPHRFNLVEGHLTFALFVNPDFSLQGTILDASSNWNGATSPAGAVSPGEQHTAQLVCDGVNTVQVLLDGVVVAESYDTVGQVRPVGPLGIAVGHWPDPPDVYTFEGTIYEFTLQKYDLQNDLMAILDPCCVDWSALGHYVQRLNREGISSSQLAEAGAALSAAGLAGELALRGNNKADTLAQRALARAAWLALGRRDLVTLEKVLREWKVTGASLDPAILASITDQFEQAFAKFGLSAAQWNELMYLLCLDLTRLGEKGHRRGCHC